MMRKAVGSNFFNNLLNQFYMKTVKMNLANMQGKMSRKEMKEIMAGSGSGGCGTVCSEPKDCSGNLRCVSCPSGPGKGCS